MIRASACSKIILFGEHAVVYGQPAIAVPITSLRAFVEITEAPVFELVTPDIASHAALNPHDHPLMPVISIITQALELPLPSIRISIRSDIPVASGLGSGAAISAAIVRAFIEFAGLRLTLEQINSIVYQTEKIHHGTPSGIDNTVIVYEKPVYYVRGDPIQPLANHTPFDLIVADTGVSAPTRISVGDVRKLRETHPESTNRTISAIGQVVQQASAAMRDGDFELLGNLMIRNHALLTDLTVSSPELDRLVDAALQAGATGAKLSGGGRGGNMIALVSSQHLSRVTDHLRHAGAVRVYHTTIGVF
jgi:mevalonate kinase